MAKISSKFRPFREIFHNFMANRCSCWRLQEFISLTIHSRESVSSSTWVCIGLWYYWAPIITPHGTHFFRGHYKHKSPPQQIKQLLSFILTYMVCSNKVTAYHLQMSKGPKECG
jgi:hypothetical protein